LENKNESKLIFDNENLKEIEKIGEGGNGTVIKCFN
jgi:hypothetical protein